MQAANLDEKTVQSFGEEWSRFDQSQVPCEELQATFEQYFKLFPWKELPPRPIGFDLGCGSGRWARFVAERVAELHCIDASHAALSIAEGNLADKTNVAFHLASVDSLPLADESMDFGYSLGVLHHVPDAQQGLQSCTQKLKPGAPFLLYLYYALDNRPWWFRALWRVSDAVRRCVAKMPSFAKQLTAECIAVAVYLPLARGAGIAERCGCNVSNFPLAAYRSRSLYTIRTDALDRFGTAIEQRFTAAQVRTLMERAALEDIAISDSPPYWCALGFKKGSSPRSSGR